MPNLSLPEAQTRDRDQQIFWPLTQQIMQQHPNSVCVCLSDLTDHDFLMWCSTQTLPNELKQSAIKRQQEFLAGRYCAARALQQLGRCDVDVLTRHANGQPAWPAGYTGSITHHQSIAVAWVTLSTAYACLAIDLEGVVSAERSQQLQKRVLSPKEIQLGKTSGYPNGLWFTLLFSCKESVYKLLSVAAGRVMPFRSVEIVAVSAPTTPLTHAGFELDGQHQALELTCQLTQDWSHKWRSGTQINVHAYVQRGHQPSAPADPQQNTQHTVQWVLSVVGLAATDALPCISELT